MTNGMTNEEAIRGLLNVKSQMAEESPFTEAIDLAVKAIEKQTPKKPLIRVEHMGYGVSPNETFKIYACPCCKEDIDGVTTYCQCCGQRIDWSEGEEA